MLPLQELQVGHLVASEGINNVVALEELCDLCGLLLVFLQLAEDLLFPLGVLGGGFVEAFELAVQVGDVVGHVGALRERKLGLCDLARLGFIPDLSILVNKLAGAELEKGKDHVAVEVGGELVEQVVLGPAAGGGGSHDGDGLWCRCYCDEILRVESDEVVKNNRFRRWGAYRRSRSVGRSRGYEDVVGYWQGERKEEPN